MLPKSFFLARDFTDGEFGGKFLNKGVMESLTGISKFGMAYETELLGIFSMRARAWREKDPGTGDLSCC
jgi:hypothetical protein